MTSTPGTKHSTEAPMCTADKFINWPPNVPVREVMDVSVLIGTRGNIEAEINAALSLYDTEEAVLSRPYWPRAFRELLLFVLRSLQNKPESWADLSIANFEVNAESLSSLVEELKQPASHYIDDRRAAILQILRITLPLRRKIGIHQHVPDYSAFLYGWPVDLKHRCDLWSSLRSKKLRRDVTDFVFSLMPWYGSKALLFGDISEPLCIQLEAPESKVEAANKAIAAASESLRARHKDIQFLPVDVIHVQGRPDSELPSGKEEDENGY